MSDKPVLFLDVDSVLADLMPEWLRRYNRDNPDNQLEKKDIRSWDIHKYVPIGQEIYSYLGESDLYDFVNPVPGAVQAYHRLVESKVFRKIVFATTVHPGTEGRKLRWLVENGFLSDTSSKNRRKYIEIADKSMLMSGQFLVEDNPHTLVEYDGYGVCYAQPWNEVIKNTDIPRIPDWDNLVEYLLASVERRERVVDKDPFDSVDVPRPRIPVFQDKNGIHPVEVTSPIQAQAFREIIEEMYTVHLDKNADYSPANILGTGMLGLVTRMWDKMARIFSLTGFKINVEFVGYSEPREPKNESLDDNLTDLANYAVITKLYKNGKWGR